MNDPQFVAKLERLKTNPQLGNPDMFSDPRLLTAFAALMGIDMDLPNMGFTAPNESQSNASEPKLEPKSEPESKSEPKAEQKEEESTSAKDEDTPMTDAQNDIMIMMPKPKLTMLKLKVMPYTRNVNLMKQLPPIIRLGNYIRILLI